MRRQAWCSSLVVSVVVGLSLIACGDQTSLGGDGNKHDPNRVSKDHPADDSENQLEKTLKQKNSKKTISDKKQIEPSKSIVSSGNAVAQRAAVSPCLVNIGKQFTETGPFEVEQRTERELNLYVPKNLPEDCKVPIVHFSNGTGSNCAKNDVISKHLASWGFITACYESGETGSGEPCLNAIATLFEKFKDRTLPRVGSIGHSQGGAGAISCAYLAEKQWSNQVQIATYAIQPAHGMNRSSYAEEYPSIHSPVFIMSGSSDFIVSDNWIESGYKALNTETHWYRAMGISHFNPENPAKNTAVAFFRWKLLEDVDGEEFIDNLTNDPQQWAFVSSKTKNQPPSP